MNINDNAALTLDEAIALAQRGRRSEAASHLRYIVARQPVNEAAWLWLSATTPDRAEAETALHQARAIDPGHHALPKAEAWFRKRFGSEPTVTLPPPNLPRNGGGANLSEEMAALPPANLPRNGGGSNSSPPLGGIEGGRGRHTPGRPLLKILLLGLVLLLGIGLAMGWLMGLEIFAPTSSAAPVALAEAKPHAPLQTAWAEKDWPAAIAYLEQLPPDQAEPAFITTHLTQAHLQQGLRLRGQGRLAEALPHFEQAVSHSPTDLRAQQELALARSYQAGQGHYQAGQWAEAIAALESIRAIDPDYPTVADLLYSAYYNRGLALEAANDLPAAQTALQAAITLRPDLAAPRRRLAELAFAAAPDTPPARPIPGVPIEERLVIVGIAEQRMHVYEGRKKVYDFVVSTGEPGSDTAIGEFEIQNKIDVAYASTWNLDMPHWMGIYWAGPLQNGIHALPTQRHTGHTLWDGYLGQRVSYGCVILGHDDSATLYEWAEVGTRVKIVPSLANWSLEAELAASKS